MAAIGADVLDATQEPLIDSLHGIIAGRVKDHLWNRGTGEYELAQAIHLCQRVAFVCLEGCELPQNLQQMRPVCRVLEQLVELIYDDDRGIDIVRVIFISAVQYVRHDYGGGQKYVG